MSRAKLGLRKILPFNSECFKSEPQKEKLYIYHYDQPRDVSKILHELVKLREDGILEEGKFLSLLKYVLSIYIENKVTEKVNSALDKTILNSLC
jgi:hypothetical protein